MPSILPGFEYDIFISYRHNDNRSGWVKEFVRALEEELAATIKAPVSVYFDTNPHDGLLETHNVDKSLEGKLKCVIFVPILSQTYCDTKSFAWQHEFCPFNALAKEDSFGRDIKLSNGNVSSRILPVKIHDLDVEDITILQKELGGVLRAIDFIFKSAGVNRPLTPGDKREENSNKTFYRDQVNKVANAIKDIISSLKNPPAAKITVKNEGLRTAKPKPKYTVVIFALLVLLVMAGYFLYFRILPLVNQKGITDKSIAVLPFVDMSPGHDQEYLGDGIADGIITILSRIEDLKVIGRTSSFQFKGEKVDLREVGEKLNVSTVLEGSVMKVANNIRIDAKLISVKDGSQIWSESFNKPMDDILTIRDQISNAIFERMKLTISGDLNPTNQPKTNSESYENVLMGKYNLEFGPEKAMKAIPYFKKAIQLDSLNGDAYLALGGAYFFLPIIGEMSPGVCYDTVTALVNKALLLKCDGHLAHSLLFGVTYYYAWDWQRAKEEYEKCIAIRYAPSIAHALFLQDVYEDQAGAVKEMLGVLEHNPLYKDGLRILGATYANAGQFDQARMTLKRLIEIDPHYGSAYLELAWLCFREKKYDLALEYTKKSEEESPDLMRSKLHHVYFLARTGKKEEARSLFQSLDPKRIPTVGMAVINFALGNEEEGFKWMDKGFENHDPWLLSIRHNYEFDQLREDPRYIATVKKMNFPQ